MELKINIDETKFKEVIEKELNAFSQEELHDIIRECIIEALHNDDMLKELFLVESRSSWGYIETKPSPVMLTAAEHIDLSPAFKEIQDKMIDTLKNNYRNILEQVMLSTIVKGLAHTYDFNSVMEQTVRNIMYNEQH